MISKTLYGCANARNKGTCDNRLNIRRDVLEATILEGLRTRLMAPDLFKVFCEEFAREINRARGNAVAEGARKEAELSKNNRRIRHIVDAIAEGVPATSLKDELLSLEDRKADIECELETRPNDALRLHPNTAEIYRDKITAFHELLEKPGTRDEAFHSIRSLIDQIVLTPDHSKLRIDLHGVIAAILQLAAKENGPIRDLAEKAEQLVMVAGARSHRELTCHC